MDRPGSNNPKTGKEKVMGNRVILNGRLGQKPELSYPNGEANDPVVNFSIATKDTWREKQTGEKRERTEWHRCFAWGKKAENFAQYMKQGKKYYLEGRLETSKYEVDGQTHYSTRVKVELVEF
jgi:single-strand DNA-binding protein